MHKDRTNMQALWMAALAVVLGSTAAAQTEITVADYERKVRSSVGQEMDIAAPEATTHEKCEPITVEYKDQIASGGCAGTVIRTYTYTNACGETASAEIYIIRTDDTGPVFDNLPGDVRCFKSEVPEVANVTATDANGQPTTVTFEVRERGGYIVRMWTATDTCGNETKGMQRITVINP